MPKTFPVTWTRIKSDLFLILIVFITALIFIPIFTYLYFAKDLQSKDLIMNRNNTGLILLDRNDKPFFKFYQAQVRVFTPLKDIPLSVQNAVIAGEDKDFYSHPGFSLKAIAGAFIADFKMGELKYGGSTITQQLVKNSLLSPKKNFLRKYQELVLAEEIDRRFSKDEILEMYLNSVYFGEGAFGVEQAAKVYFGKNIKDLNLAQSAFLAGLLPAPSIYSPYAGGTELAKSRQKYILDTMLKKKFITKKDHDLALTQELVFESKQEDINNLAPHFALMVRDQLINEYGEEMISRGGFRVKTTLNLDWQEFAEKTVKNGVNQLEKDHATNGAAVVIDPPTGQVEVLVGSKDWYNQTFGKMNMATTPRQPGSSFKPIVYLAALEDRIITPATILKDEPITYVDGNPVNSSNQRLVSQIQNYSPQSIYKPKNYDNKFRGPVTVRRALSNSLNVPSVEVMNKVGIPRALEMGKRLGINSLKDPSDYGLSLVLGSAEISLLEMTGAYSVFANQGVYNPPVTILEIQNKDGQEVFKYQPRSEVRVDQKYTFLISSILSDSVTRAEEFGNALNNSLNAAVKTGTTENYRDALTLGYTPDLAVGVWVGNNDNSSMDSVAGSLGAAPIWRQLIEQFQKGKSVRKFERPAGIVSLSVCRSGTKEASASAWVEYFVSGTQPKKPCANPNPSSSPSSSASPQPTPTAPATEAPTPSPAATPTSEPTILIQPEIKEDKKDKPAKESQLPILLTNLSPGFDSNIAYI